MTKKIYISGKITGLDLKKSMDELPKSRDRLYETGYFRC